MSGRYLKVKDVEGAVRDVKSNAVLFSGGKSKQAQARKQYARKLQESENQREILEDRINKLEQLVNRILEDK